MLEDRDYMRQPQFHERRISLTVAILILNAVVFVVECLLSSNPLQFSPNNEFFYQYFALSVAGLKHFYLWQLITYQFMHAGFLHILLNCWVIFVFGRAIEETIGKMHFLILFLSSGIAGGIFQTLAALACPDLFGGSVVGASAAAFGLVAAFAVLFPERELTLLLFFVLPLRLTAKMLLILSAALAVGGLFVRGDNIANAAHLGGMVFGIFYVRQIIRETGFNFHHAGSRRANLPPPARAKGTSGARERPSRARSYPQTNFCSGKLTRFSIKFPRAASRA